MGRGAIVRDICFGLGFNRRMPKPQRMPEPDEQVVLDELRVDLISAKQKAKWDRLVCKHHYLKNARLVGEQLRYVVTAADGRWLALIGWSAPALHLKARDQSIEWTVLLR